MSTTATAPVHATHKGLTAQEVLTNRQKYGANLLTPPAREPWWKQFLSKFDDPVIRILIIAAVIAIVVGIAHNEYAEGIGIIIAILLATTLAFLNEYKANREFDILNKVNDDVAIKAIRDGQFTTVPRKDLVVEDIVLLEVGEEAPADGKVLEAVSFQADESRLTGESVPVNKVANPGPPDPAHPPAYPPDQVMRGCMIVDGHGMVRLTAVGDSTELGKTARAAAEETDEDTPLNQQLERLSKLIGVVGLGVAALVFTALLGRGVFTGELLLWPQQWVFADLLIVSVLVALIRVWLPIVYDGLDFLGVKLDPPGWLETESIVGWLICFGVGAGLFGLGLVVTWFTGLIHSDPSNWMTREASNELLKFFMIAVTVIVVAVPEGLAMSVTLSLAYSMRKMTAENNLVRKMHACETIGAATVICSDKTGTLTRNEMRVFEGRFPAVPKLDANNLDEHAALLVEGIAANSTANLTRDADGVKALGNPTEGALLLWLNQNGIDYIPLRTDFNTHSQWTFTTERKFMGTLGTSPRNNRKYLYVKGAPEIVLGRCSRLHGPEGDRALTDADRAKVREELLQFQKRGMRTLGFAYRNDIEHPGEMKLEDFAGELTWLGFVAIADPIRDEVPPAVAACREAGVQVKIVTGDNPDTAQEIARQIGLWQATESQKRHLSGTEFGALDDAKAKEAANDLVILSRARPMDKLRLVRLLKDSGHVVAVTGDGTNDAPALNHADVGLAMGKTGTSVAKEASDIILLDDSFSSIINAVMWGRSLYENIQRFILFQLTINVVALGIALMGPFIGIQLPLTVTQMLWVNLIMDTFAALALATEPAYPGVLKRPPRRSEDFIVSNPMALNIFVTGAIFLVVLASMLAMKDTVTGWLTIPTPPAEVTDKASYNRDYFLSFFFSVFVFLQFWNLFNARVMARNESAFAGLFHNTSFLLIAAAIFVGQIVLVTFGGKVFRTQPLSWQDWLIVIVGTSSVLWIGEVIRLVTRMRAPNNSTQASVGA